MGCPQQSKQLLDTMFTGGFMNKSHEDGWEYWDEVAKKSLTWSYEDVADRAMASQGPGGSGKFSINEHQAIETKMEQLAKKLERLELKGEKETMAINHVVEVCVICETMGHTTDNCQKIPAFKNVLSAFASEEVNALNQRFDPNPQPFNSGWKQTSGPRWNQPNEADSS
ncbi:hypothetical protein RHMOL_Rhmol11G0024800 [Rhododendron molle]|uniref:Uncharacterized protein n=1 Tax=Rhododendron molle TaxID=49168 RepID=A0ACC0LPI2_RHOML|nr:hypothetical protein RHMOL_Rhmol11G0024800 [Rhododendron molle]